MKRFEFVKAVNDKYVKTSDWRDEEDAKRAEAAAQKARAELTAAKIADLNHQVEDRIVFFLEKKTVDKKGVKVKISFGAKVVMLRQITMLPEDVFDRKALVTLFATLCNRDLTLTVAERRKLESVAYRARLEGTLKAGLSTEPAPIPVEKQEMKVQEAPIAAEGVKTQV
jgi:hypothetical protein